MRSLSLHLKLLIISLFLLGVGIISYQIFIEGRPLTEKTFDNSWTVEVTTELKLNSTGKAKLEFLIPANETDNYKIQQENFWASDFGQFIEDYSIDNRKLIWSARKVSGKKQLFYRADITRTNESNNIVDPTLLVKSEINLTDSQKKLIQELTDIVRQRSTNINLFIRHAINLMNDDNEPKVKLLLGKNHSIENKLKFIEQILLEGNIPIQYVHTINLNDRNEQSPELWLRSHFASGNDKAMWHYFNPSNGQEGLSEDDYIWWVGRENNVASLVEGAGKVKTSFIVSPQRVTTQQMMGLISDSNDLSNVSFYNLPLATQEAYKIMLTIPFGVLMILILRNIVGIKTLGTFTPVLIALAFRETGLVFGMIFFSIVVFFGLLLRSYLEHLKLQMLPRLSVLLTFVVSLVVLFGLLSYQLKFEKGLSITLFPMVILTMTIERLSITWEERGSSNAMKIALGTLFTAALANFIMNYPPLSYFVFTFPAILLILVAFMLLMGRYNGYRLLELTRFKALTEK